MGAKENDKDAGNAAAANPAAATTSKKEDKKEKIVLPIEALQENLYLLDASVVNKDQAGIKRVLRKNTFIRRKIKLDDFRVIMDLWLPGNTQLSKQLHSDLDKLSKQKMETDGEEDDDEGDESNNSKKKSEALRAKYLAKEKKSSCIPEVEVYLQLFVSNALLNAKMIKEADANVSSLLAKYANDTNTTLDVLIGKAWYLKARCAELQGQLNDLRGEMLIAHRKACLKFSEFSQATLINLILRSFCEANLIEQASKFASKATYPEHVSNNQQVRHLYYMGRIHAIQLDYSLSFMKLTQALRKAPAHTGLGFRIAVHKLAAIVQLLMGEMPERSNFSTPELAAPLKPYFELCKAVRNGSLAEYDEVCKVYGENFAKDKVSTLVVRLRNSVIRTGLRRISLAYSCISFKDIAKRLALDSPESAELICAKAIRDGVIEAKINHEKAHLTSSDVMDIYSTAEPQQAFSKRIDFCLGIFNEAIKSHRYPPDAHKVKHQLDEEKERTEEEIAQEIEKELEEDE